MEKIKKILGKKRLVYFTVSFLFFVAFSNMTHTVGAEEGEPTGLPPIADAGGPYIVDECFEVVLDASNSWDPDGDMLFYRWNIEGEWSAWSSNPFIIHVWYDDYVGTVTLEVTDLNFISTDTADVTVENVAPYISFDYGPFIATYAGINLELSVEFFDPDPRSQSNDEHTAIFSWGDGTTSIIEIIDEEFIAISSHIYENIGIYELVLTVTDDDGGVGSDSIIIVVMGVDAGPDVTIDEGDTFTSSGSFLFMEPANNGIVNYGDGSDYQPLILNEDGTFDLNHIYLDDGVFNVVVLIENSDGYLIGGDEVVVTVNNVAPDIISIEGVPVDPIIYGTAVQITSSFNDPGVLDTHIASIDWGDGIQTEGAINDYIVTGSHIYNDPGVFTITLTVTDDDGGVDVEIFQYVVVYDPNEGFVTGGGWINSPPGAYMVDPTLEGKATFGFVSKYKKGKTIPEGNTEFQFHAAGLNFHSRLYDWLVIAGSKAMYKGTGTINGEGNYGFILSAIDGDLKDDVDKFRIKIWDKDTGQLVYDNNINGDDYDDPATVLGSGQIKIHKK